MTTYDIEYKVGDVDNVGAVLKENGVGVNLTGYFVDFVMKNDAGVHHTVTCSEGGMVNGIFVPFTQGGVTTEFTALDTAAAGEFNGEFVVYNDSGSIRFPSGNNYLVVKVWEAI